MADSLTWFIVVPLALLKIGIWICCCLARYKRHPAQQGVLIVRPDTTVIQTSVIRQGDRNGLIVNEFPTSMTTPQYGFHEDGNIPPYMNCAGMNRDGHPTMNSFQHDTSPPLSGMHAPPTYEETMKSKPV